MSKTEKIIAAARQRFYYYGLTKTTMQEIAADAGVAVGTLYLYFSNKDELMVACAADFVGRHRRDIDAILAADTPSDQKLRDYIVSRYRESKNLRTGTRHATELARAVIRVKPDRIQEEGLIMVDTVTKILELGVRKKVFRIARPKEDAKVFLFSVAWFFPNALSPPPFEPEEADLLSVVDWFIKVWKGQRSPSRKPRKRQAARR